MLVIGPNAPAQHRVARKLRRQGLTVTTATECADGLAAFCVRLVVLVPGLDSTLDETTTMWMERMAGLARVVTWDEQSSQPLTRDY